MSRQPQLDPDPFLTLIQSKKIIQQTKQRNKETKKQRNKRINIRLTGNGREGRRAARRGAESGRGGRGRDDVRRHVVLDLAAARLSRAVDLCLVAQLENVAL